MVAIVIHADQSTACACELVALHDAPPCRHPCTALYALGATCLRLQRGQSRGGDGCQPVWQSLQLHGFPYQATIGLRFRAGGCRSLPSLMTCGHRQEKQRHFPLTLPISFQDEWGRLLARLTCPVFAQVADDGQRRFVAQIKREWFGLVLLGCGFRVHVLGCGRAASWTEPDHGRAAAR